MFDRLQPYNALPLLPPPADLESRAVLRALNEASRAVGELKGRTRTLPNPDILLNTIALQEAKASSAIENIATTNDELYRGLDMDSLGLSPNAREVLHYREALWHGVVTLRERPVLTANLAIEIVTIIKENTAGVRRLPGTKLRNPDTGEIIYTPPEGEDHIRDLLTNWEKFVNAGGDQLDPLLKLAVMHYQFEAIHPFTDGNGRTGRILLILYLLMEGLLDEPILFLSRHILENRAAYNRGLREVTERRAWEDWLIFILNAVAVTARLTCEKMQAIASLFTRRIETRRAELPKRAASKELVELLFVRPYCRIRFVEEALKVSRNTAAAYLRDAEKAGWVRPIKSGNEVLFVNEELMKILTDNAP